MKRILPGLCALVFAGTAFAAPFQNGSFEFGASLTCGAGDNLLAGSGAIPGWTVSVGSIDWTGPCNWVSQNGSHSLDLIGGGATAVSVGGVQQTFDTIAGATYQVSFYLAANPSTLFGPMIKPLTVTVAGTTHNYTFDRTGHDGTSAANMGWALQTFTFVATGSTSTINFVSDISPETSFAGAALDNVSITLVPASTTTTLATSGSPATAGSSVTITATVTGTNNPTGTVEFTDGGSTIAGCSAPVLLTGTGNTKTASCTTSGFAVGTHSIVGYYGGDTDNYSSQGPLTQVIALSAPTAWTGSAGSVTNQGVSIGSLPSVVSDGTAGPAVFTYETVNDYCCHTGDWTFETTATATGPVTLNWSYSGYHGTCRATATLTPYAKNNGGTTYGAPLYSAADSDCHYQPPSGGFGTAGQVTLQVDAGYAYGFQMHASNGDFNGGVQGRLTVTTGTAPTTTTVAASTDPVVYGASVKLTAAVAGNTPTGTVTFTQDTRVMYGCDAVPVVNGSAACWTVLPQGTPNIVANYSGDTANAGSVSSPLAVNVNSGPPTGSFVVNSTADAADATPGDGTCADSQGRCTLRAAAREASLYAGAATITVPPGTYALTLGAIDISGSVTVNGAGAGNTIVDGGGLDRVFTVSSGVVTISGLTVRNGHASGNGGGIANSGALSLYQAVVSGNASDTDGGGIFNQGTLLALNGSTVSGNVGGGGAGIYSYNSVLTLTNSTVSGNHSIGVGQCGFGGGGLWIYSGRSTITSSTLYENFAECTTGTEGRGHAIASTVATTTVRNSILSSPGRGAQVCYGPVTSLGHNFADDGSCGPVATDLINPNTPQLLPLGDYGGPTPTHELLLGSPARDAVPTADCATALDQGGTATATFYQYPPTSFPFRRPQGPACDIGAVESAPLPTQAATTTMLASLPNPAVEGASVTYTATVTTTVPGSNPTGLVDFTYGSSLVLGGCGSVPLTVTGDSGTAVCTTSSLPAGSWLVTARFNGNLTNQSSSGTTTQVINPAPPAFASPSLIRVIEDSAGSSTFVVGRANGALPSGTNIEVLRATSCVGGVPSGLSSVGSFPGSTVANADGYFGATVPNVVSGQFLVVRLANGSGTPISDASACIPSLAGNDFWTTALLVGGDSPAAGASSANDYIDAPGKTRWYRFKVAPGQQIAVSLNGAGGALPADYDLAVFKDIGAAFLAQVLPADSTALAKLSAEFAPSTFSPSTFSPSTFSPSTFSPSTFSPDAFAPSTFSPSTFSPSTFSPSTFSPSTFSPSTFSPSTFSPSTFSPSTFSPSTFSPSTFSPSTFSPDVINTAFSSAQTRSLIGVSATAGTIPESVVVDSWNNSGYFYVRVTGRGAAFSSDGQFTIGVTKSASSCTSVTDTTLTSWPTPTETGKQTIILTDTSSFAGSADVGTMTARLNALALSTRGVVVDVGSAGYSHVQALKSQALGNPACPFATNLVAEEIKGIVDSYRQNNNLKFVVIAGGDDVVPFFRYPDQSMLAQESGYVPPVTGPSDASLRGDFVLSQDTYGARTRISLRSSDYPVPGLAVGRLVKTPTEIAAMIDAGLPYLTTVLVNGTPQGLAPTSSLVTGYDFLADAANAVKDELACGTGFSSFAGCTTFSAVSGTSQDALITPNGVSHMPDPTTGLRDPSVWAAGNLRATLLGPSRHDVVFLAGHFNANSALAADFATNLITTDLAGSTTDLTNSIVFSAGCHSGYGIVNRDALPGATFTLDWAQAFAQKKATLVAGTGYQYGDTDFIEYSERLYLNFARELRAGSGPVAIGQALVNAKVDYLAATPDIRGIHTKALLEATLYGLPMLGVNMPSGRGGPAGGSFAGAITPNAVTDPALPATTLGLRIAELPLSLNPFTNTQQLYIDSKNTLGPVATWLQGIDGVVSNPSEPALPLNVVNATPTDPAIVLRGVGFRGGSYSDSQIVPLTGAPATEIRGVHVPFAAPNFFPNRPWAVNYFGALAGNGATSLLVTPAQHRGADVGTDGFLRSTLRKYSALSLRLYYSGGNFSDVNYKKASLSDAPTIVKADARASGTGSITFTAQVTGDPAAAIHEVWVTYTDGGGSWVSVDLQQCVATSTATLPAVCGTTADSQIWMGTATTTASAIQYIVQAASGTGLVTFDDNRGAYYALTGLNSGVPTSTTQQAAAAAATSLAFGPTPSSAAYGDTVSVTATLTSGGSPVAGGLVNLNIGGFGNSGLTDSNGSVTLKATVSSAPGTNPPITASYAGSGTALLPSSVATSFTVAQAAPTITALAAPAVGVQLTAPVVAANTTTYQPLAGQSVSFAFSDASFTKTIVINTDTNGNATVPTTGLPAGTYAIAARFLPAALAGQTTYYSGATLTLAQFTMNAQPITFVVPASATYAPPGTFAVSAAVGGPAPGSGQPVSIASTTPQVCTVSGTPTAGQANYTATIVSAGANCGLSASVGGTSTFAPAQASTTIPIAFGAQSVTFTAPSSLPYQQSTTLPARTDAPASQLITYTIPAVSGVPANCSVNGNTVTAASATGSCTIAAQAPGTTLYNAYANANLATITLQKASQTINFAAPPGRTYGDPPFQISATATSALPVAFAATGPCTLSGTTVTITGVGNCSITASQGGNTIYNAAANVTQVVAIAKARITVSISATPSSFTYGDDLAGGTTPRISVNVTTIPTVCLSVAAGIALNPPTFSITPTPPSAAPWPAGHYTITASGGISNANCEVVVSANGAIDVLKATPQFENVASFVPLGATGASIPGQLHRQDKATVFPSTAADVQTLGFTLSQAGVPSATATLTPPVAPNGQLSVKDPAAKPATYSLELRYMGGPDFNAAVVTPFVTSVRVEGFATTMAGSPAAIVSMTQARSDHTSTLLGDGRVLLTGGKDASGIASQTAEVYCPFDMPAPAAPLTLAILCPSGLGQFSGVGALHGKSSAHAAVRLNNGKVLIVGNGSTELFDPATNPNQFTSISGATARSYHTATLLPTGKVLVAGGVDSAGNTLQTTQIYDPATNSFAAGPTLLSARERHTATPYTVNGATKVLIGGGRQKAGSSYSALRSTEIYDPATNRVTVGPSMAGARFSHEAEVLNDGRVLVAGGSAGTAATPTNSLSSAELFKVASDGSTSWTTISASSDLHDARRDFTLSKLADGRLLAVGGAGTSRLASSEYFSVDPSTQAVSSTVAASLVAPPASPGRSNHAASRLLNGSVLVTGGINTAGTAITSAQIYNGPTP